MVPTIYDRSGSPSNRSASGSSTTPSPMFLPDPRDFLSVSIASSVCTSTRASGRSPNRLEAQLVAARFSKWSAPGDDEYAHPIQGRDLDV